MLVRAGALAALALLAAACGREPTTAEPSAAADAPTPTPTESALPPAAAAAPVLTAEGYGPVRVGMTRDEVVRALGEDSDPEAVGGPDPERCDQFRPARAPEGLMVMVEGGRLTRISLLQGSTLKSAHGFGVGDTAAAVKAGVGANAVVTPHKYVEAPAEYVTVWTKGGGKGPEYVSDPQARGVVYEIGREGRVTAVHAGGPSIQYVEGCA